MLEFLQSGIGDILRDPWASVIVVGNLILIESLLSVDNAAVLATMVMDLPEEQRDRALKWGIWGAYIFRGLALLFAGILIQIWWLKPLGGLYLLYLVWDWWKGNQEDDQEHLAEKSSSWYYQYINRNIGTFWATVVSVEVMDIAFSIDNVFAAVAYSDKLLLVIVGVFIGILAMRFIAGKFVKLMESYPFLETSAFVVIAILGLRLTLSLWEYFRPESVFTSILNSHTAEGILSTLTLLIFAVPVLTSHFLNWPEKKNKK